MKTWRFGYLICAWLFVLGILTQVFLVGLSLLGKQPSWSTHIGLGHGLGIVALLLLVMTYVGALPQLFKRLTWLVFVLYILLADIVPFFRDSIPLISALHPVLAIILFALTSSLALRARQLKRANPKEAMEGV